jgi:hypothetical protein
MVSKAVWRLSALMLVVAPAFAAPPDNADPRLRDWFQGLRQPFSGAPCCSIADCRRTEARQGADGWEVLIDDNFGVRISFWAPVPRNKVLKIENPTGQAVACFIPSVGVMCFVPPPET